MGSLDGDVLNVLDSAGEISDVGRARLIAQTQGIMAVGPGAAAGILALSGTDVEFDITDIIGVVSLGAVGALLAAAFGRDTLEEHQTDYEAWHRIMVDGLYKGLANGFNIDSQYPITPVMDPTFIVIMVINWVLEKLQLEIDVDIDIPTILINLPAIVLLIPTIPGDCEAFIDMIKLCGKNDDFSSDPDDDGKSICDIFPITIEMPVIPLPSMPELPSFAIPGIALPSFPFGLVMPGLPDIPGFFIELFGAIPAWFAELVLDFTVSFPEFLVDIPAFIEWIIQKIIELIMKVMAAVAGYIAFVAVIAVIIKDMVVWIAVDLIVAVLGPGMIAAFVAGILGY